MGIREDMEAVERELDVISRPRGKSQADTELYADLPGRFATIYKHLEESARMHLGLTRRLEDRIRGCEDDIADLARLEVIPDLERLDLKVTKLENADLEVYYDMVQRVTALEATSRAPKEGEKTVDEKIRHLWLAFGLLGLTCGALVAMVIIEAVVILNLAAHH